MNAPRPQVLCASPITAHLERVTNRSGTGIAVAERNGNTGVDSAVKACNFVDSCCLLEFVKFMEINVEDRSHVTLDAVVRKAATYARRTELAVAVR